MADVHSVEVRSFNMSRIRSKNTKPELLVRKYLHREGFRFRIHVTRMPGKPDIVLPKYKTVVFIHGCFWHGHNACKYFVVPKTRTDWWLQKINNNKLNDEKSIVKLHENDWDVVVIYECQLKKNVIDDTLKGLKLYLKAKYTASFK